MFLAFSAKQPYYLSSMAVLYIIATPIGNLKDVSFRAIEAFKESDLILCEDTRVSRKLLDHYEIKKPLLSYHQHSKLKKLEQILSNLKEGKKLALISDAGTPAISDPGAKLIDYLIDKIQLEIIPIPGPSALTAALSIAGVGVDKFIFLGFPPTKRKRQKFFKEVGSYRYPVVLYESPHRIIKTLKELDEFAGSDYQAVVCRELTKMFETVYRGSLKDILKELEKETKIKGEFVIILKKQKHE